MWVLFGSKAPRTTREEAVTVTARKSKASTDAGKGKGPQDHKGKASKGKAPRESKLDKAIRLQAEAVAAQEAADADPSDVTLRDAALAAHGVAVLAWLPVPEAEVPPTARTYCLQYGSVVMSLAKRADDTVTRRATVVEEARKSLQTAKSMAAQRTADVVAFVRGTVDVHKWLTAQEFCGQYGVTKSQVSKWRLAGEVTTKLDVKSPTRVAQITSAVSHDMSGVRAAAKAPGATFDTVISDAAQRRGETTRAAREAQAGSEETPALAAHTLAVSLTKQLRHLNTTGTAVADRTDPDVTGRSVVRDLLSALAAYAARELPDLDPVPVPAPTLVAVSGQTGQGPAGKRLPRPHARTAGSKS